MEQGFTKVIALCYCPITVAISPYLPSYSFKGCLFQRRLL